VGLGRRPRPAVRPYWATLGHALTQSGRSDGEAEAAFLRAEHAAPAHVVLDSMARDAVETLVDRARRRQSMSDNLRMLARRLKIDIA
jgi:hypothetical protein